MSMVLTASSRKYLFAVFLQSLVILNNKSDNNSRSKIRKLISITHKLSAGELTQTGIVENIFHNKIPGCSSLQLVDSILVNIIHSRVSSYTKCNLQHLTMLLLSNCNPFGSSIKALASTAWWDNCKQLFQLHILWAQKDLLALDFAALFLCCHNAQE